MAKESLVKKVVNQTGVNNVNPTLPNPHDLRVVVFHLVVAVAQTLLVGAGIEHPNWVPFIQTIAELLRRIVV